jgi:hypothetical protein
MIHRRSTIVLSTIVLLLCLGALLPGAMAQQSQHDTPGEAQAMLSKAVAAVKANQSQAIEMFNAGQGGFLEGDLFPFCFRLSDGKTVATQLKQRLGDDVRTAKGPTGKAFGQELYAAAQKPEGEITEVSYVITRPGSDLPVEKVSFITRVGDLGCGVGYYK